MPYKKFICYNGGEKKYCTKNLKTGQIVRYSSEENRITGIRIREAIASGWRPTGKRKSSTIVRKHRRKGRSVRKHRRRLR